MHFSFVTKPEHFGFENKHNCCICSCQALSCVENVLYESVPEHATLGPAPQPLLSYPEALMRKWEMIRILVDPIWVWVSLRDIAFTLQQAKCDWLNWNLVGAVAITIASVNEHTWCSWKGTCYSLRWMRDQHIRQSWHDSCHTTATTTARKYGH